MFGLNSEICEDLPAEGGGGVFGNSGVTGKKHFFSRRRAGEFLEKSEDVGMSSGG